MFFPKEELSAGTLTAGIYIAQDKYESISEFYFIKSATLNKTNNPKDFKPHRLIITVCIESA